MLSDKKLVKIQEILGQDILQEMDSLSDELLKEGLVKATSSIAQATAELENNPTYQSLKESIKALSQGLRDVKRYQGAIIQYALHRLESKE